MVTSVQSRLGEAPEEGIKAPCVTIATGNETLFGIGQTIGGVVIADQDRVIVAAQTDSTENGIYVARGGKSWERAADFNLIDDVSNGMLVADRNTGNIFLISVPNTGWNPGVDTANFILQFAPSGITWGSITGTLSTQGDLQAELDAKAAAVHTHVEADITDLQPYLLDAPSDGNDYGRRDGAWVDLNLTGLYAPLNHTHFEADILDLQDYLLDAPNDGDFYARRNLSWEMITTAAGTIGEIVMWPFEDVPENFLSCDGQSYNTTTFGALFAVIGYRYGGSGANFNVPDLRGEFIRGWANGSGRDPDRASRTNAGDGTTGDFVGTKQPDAQVPHTHGIRGGGSDDDGGPRPPGGTSNTGALEGTQSGGGHGTGNEVRPRNVYMQFIIRYSGGGSGDASVPAVAVQDNGVELTSAVELFNFLNFNLSQPVVNQIEIAFGASPNAAAFCPNYGFNFVNVSTFEIPGLDATNTVFAGRRIRFVDGATNLFGTVLTSVFASGDTTVTMDMDGADVLTATVSEFCLVNGAGGWTAISGDPFGGDPVNDLYSGFIGGTKYWQACSTAGKVAYSTDGGNTWTLASTPTSENCNQIGYNPDSETFQIACENGVILRSTDGTTWTANTDILGIIGSGPGHVRAIIYDENNADQWMVLAQSNVGGSLLTANTTDDGLNWSFVSNVAGTVASLATGFRYQRGSGQSQLGFLYNVNDDFYSLTDSNDTTASVFSNVSGQPFGRAISSFFFNGISHHMFGRGSQLWENTAVRDDATFGSSNINGMVYSPTLERLVIVGEDGMIGIMEAQWVDDDYLDYIRLEANGANPLADYLCVHWDPDDGIFCAGNNQGQIVRSVNGLGQPVSQQIFNGWTLIGSDPFGGAPINRVMSGLIGATTWWVAIGNNGQLFTSTDAGATWQSRTSGVTSNLISIGYNSTNQQFFIGCDNGDFIHSTSGTSWTADTTTIAALGGAGSNAISGVVWDPTANEWMIILAFNAGVTRRTYSTTSAVTVFTSRNTSVNHVPNSVCRIGSNSVIVWGEESSDDSYYHNGALDTTDSIYGSASNVGQRITCVGVGAGTDTYTLDTLTGYGNGTIKRWGSGLGSATARGLANVDPEVLTNVRINGIAQSGSRWIITCDNGEIYTLPNGSMDVAHNAFAQVTNPFTANINDVWYDANDGVFVAVGSNGEIGTSTDGIS